MQYISLGTEKLYYTCAGSGKKILLAFHGYGKDSGSFLLLEHLLGQEYTILAFDLPHHGSSKWTEDKPLAKTDMRALLSAVKESYGISRVSLLGYSMGGRICLAVAALDPAGIDKIVLLASDGLKWNFYYYFFTRNALGKRLFSGILRKHHAYFRIIDILKAVKLIGSSHYKFIMQYLGTENGRQFLLQVWPGLSDLTVTPWKIKAIIKNYKIPVYIFMGAYDKIIPLSVGKKFKSGMRTVQLFVLEKGHNLLDKESAEQVARCLLS